MTWRKARFGLFRYNSGYDRVAPTFPRLVGQRFPFPGGPRPREPGSPSAIAGSARATTSPSIDGPAQTVLGCVENVLVRVDQNVLNATQNSLCRRSEEHTSELQSDLNLVCRLLLEKKKNKKKKISIAIRSSRA